MQALNHLYTKAFAVLLMLGATSANLLLAAVSSAQTLDTAVAGDRPLANEAIETALATVKPTASHNRIVAIAPAETTLAAPGESETPLPVGQTPVAPVDLTAIAEPVAEPPSTSADDLLANRPNTQVAQFEDSSEDPSDAADPGQPPELDESQPALSTDTTGFRFSFDSGAPDPTTLMSSMRRRPVRTPIKSTGIAIVGSVRQGFGSSYLNLGIEGGEHIIGFDLGFNSTFNPSSGGFGVNFFNQQSWFPAYRGGDNEVDLPNGETPWIDRLGGGVEFFLPLAEEVDSSLGVSYQRITVRDDPFTSEVFPTDEFGNQLTVDGDGVDDQLSLNFALLWDHRYYPNELFYPTDGSLARFGINQGFNLGEEDIAFTRFSGTYTQFIPVNLFGFRSGPRTLIFNIQAGTILGDVPSYEGFNVGGNNSVRGYSGGGIGTGTSFLTASLEYRFPIALLNVFSNDIDLGGTLFVDYGTTFGTDDEVIGEPGEVRDKPGDGFGFGLGLQAVMPIGFGRLEFAVNDEGDSEVIATIGDRF